MKLLSAFPRKDEVSVHKERLVKIMEPLLRPESLATLKSLPEVDGYVALASLVEKDFAFKFDPAQVELQILLTIEQRATGKLSADTRAKEVMSENLSQPATFAGYVNIRGGADYATQSLFEDGDMSGLRLAFQGAARYAGVVFESEANLVQNGGVSRGGTRLVYDMAEENLQFSGGDIRAPERAFKAVRTFWGCPWRKTTRSFTPPPAFIQPPIVHSALNVNLTLT